MHVVRFGHKENETKFDDLPFVRIDFAFQIINKSIVGGLWVVRG